MQPAVTMPPVRQLTDEFPGLEDLNAHVLKALPFGSESASSAEGSGREGPIPSIPTVATRLQLRPPPGLENEMPSPLSQMPAYICSSLTMEQAMEASPVTIKSLRLDSRVHAGPVPDAAHATHANAASAILMAQQDFLKQEGTLESRKMFADVFRIAMDKLQRQEDLAPQRHRQAPDLESAPRPGTSTHSHARLPEPQRSQQAAQSEGLARSLKDTILLELPKFPTISNLRSEVRELRGKNPECVLVVRKIQKLGLNSLVKIREYFEWFGAVDAGLAAPVHARKSHGRSRLRPSHMGFVVFESREAVHAVLAKGPEHIIMGVHIAVEQYTTDTNSEQLQ